MVLYIRILQNSILAGDSTLDPTWGAYDATPDPLVVWRGGIPPPHSLLPQCLWLVALNIL